MEQLMKVTSIPFQSIRFSQTARLIPSNMMELERRKAMARHSIFRARAAAGQTADFNYMKQLNHAFSKESLPPPSETSCPEKPPVPSRTAAKTPALQAPAQGGAWPGGPSQALPSEPLSAYTAQRGALELRSIRGELSFVPPLDLTIILQYPSVHFEYTGDFNYVPPKKDHPGGNVNLTA